MDVPKHCFSFEIIQLSDDTVVTFCGGCAVKGKSDGKITKMSVSTEIRDLEAVIEYARNRTYGNPREIVLMGCSQGGLVSAMTASRLYTQISKLILLYPAFCIPDEFWKQER